ncbi:MAG: hypothetical protein Q6373_011050 [Candidatus Sigynarchaeota archaeon]
MIGLPDERQWAAVEAFSTALESFQRGTLRFHANDNITFGQAWNTARNTEQELSFCAWAWKLPGMLLATTIEIPYATASGSKVNTTTARLAGARHNKGYPSFPGGECLAAWFLKKKCYQISGASSITSWRRSSA